MSWRLPMIASYKRRARPDAESHSGASRLGGMMRTLGQRTLSESLSSMSTLAITTATTTNMTTAASARTRLREHELCRSGTGRLFEWIAGVRDATIPDSRPVPPESHINIRKRKRRRIFDFRKTNDIPTNTRKVA